MSATPDNLQALADAVARNAAVVLSLPSAGMMRHQKTRFLGDCEQGIWVEFEADAIPLLKELHGNGHPLALSFTIGTRRVSFATTVLQIEQNYRVNAQTTAQAILVDRPNGLKGAQRRASYRVRVSRDTELTSRFWVITEHAHLSDQPLASTEIKAELRDLSLGGMGLRILPNDVRPVSLVADQRLRVLLRYGQDELVLDARLRTAFKQDAPKPCGIVFKKLESDLEGRQKLGALTRIVGELQREEVRRMRLGLAS
jgi:hypothetical protein